MKTTLPFISMLAALMFTGCSTWHLEVRNLTKERLNDVSVGWDNHVITAGVLGYDPRFAVGATFMHVPDIVGSSRIPTNVLVQYTTQHGERHDVSLGIPKTLAVDRSEVLVISIAENENITVRKRSIGKD